MGVKQMEPEHKEYICILLAQFKKGIDIPLLFQEKYGYKLFPNQITRIKLKHKEEIAKLRSKFVNDLSEVPIIQKRVRAERIEELYQLAGTLPNLKMRIDTQLKCLQSAYVEVEGKTQQGVTYNAQYNQFGSLSDKELKGQISKLRKEIIGMEKKGGLYAIEEGKQ